MSYSIYKAFVTYVTYIDHFRDTDYYRKGAKVIRNGLPSLERGQPGFRDVMTIKNFVEWVLTEEEMVVELATRDDAAATVEALSDEIKSIEMTNPDEIKKEIFMS